MYLANRKSILLLWDRVGDYHRARWKALQQEVLASSRDEVPDHQQTHQNSAPTSPVGIPTNQPAVYIADLGASDELYQWQNTLDDNHFQLSDKPVTQFDFFPRLWKLHHIIKKHNIKVIGINGYGKLEYPFIILLCKMAGIKIILFAESWYAGNILLDKIKGWFLRKTIHGFLVSGKLAFQHFQQRLKIPENKIQTGYSVVDNQHFAKEDNKIAPIRQTLLCVARFAPPKNLKTLIQAFIESTIASSWQLKLVGGGPLINELKSEANNHPNIIFSDWLSYQELPALYHAANFFVLPSSFEPWGLVVNEAAAAGLPLILSSQCGCHPELLDQGNGFFFDAHNQQELVSILNQLPSLSEEQIAAMGRSSLAKVRNLTPHTWARNFIDLVNRQH